MQSNIQNTLGKLEENISSASKMPGIGNKAVVDIKKLKSIHDELVNSIPEELLEASEVLKQKESIINQAYLEAKRTKGIAQQESASVNEKARNDYEQKISDSKITKGAQSKSEDIISEANKKANEIVEEGEGQADKILEQAQNAATHRKEGADQYSKEVLFNIEERLSQILAQVRRGIDALNEDVQQDEQAKISVNGNLSNS